MSLALAYVALFSLFPLLASGVMVYSVLSIWLLLCLSICRPRANDVFIVSPSADPTYCPAYTTETYDCNCHSCQCSTCYSCGCSAAYFSSCQYDSCSMKITPVQYENHSWMMFNFARRLCSGDCWCDSFGCRCCRDANCATPCNCRLCCDSCTRQTCPNQVFRVMFFVS